MDNFDRARLERRAQFYRHDAVLEKAADLFDSDPDAWQKLPVLLQDRSGMYRDFRADYRAAVAAGVIPNDRGRNAT